jgi:hypothetical protein
MIVPGTMRCLDPAGSEIKSTPCSISLFFYKRVLPIQR